MNWMGHCKHHGQDTMASICHSGWLRVFASALCSLGLSPSLPIINQMTMQSFNFIELTLFFLCVK